MIMSPQSKYWGVPPVPYGSTPLKNSQTWCGHGPVAGVGRIWLMMVWKLISRAAAADAASRTELRNQTCAALGVSLFCR